MASVVTENQLESIVQSLLGDRMGDKAMFVFNGVSKLAAKQGGETTIENYQLLAKRALIVAGATIIGVQIVTSVVGYFASRRTEEQRIERIVRRVVDEQRNMGATF